MYKVVSGNVAFDRKVIVIKEKELLSELKLTEI